MFSGNRSSSIRRLSLLRSGVVLPTPVSWELFLGTMCSLKRTSVRSMSNRPN